MNGSRIAFLLVVGLLTRIDTGLAQPSGMTGRDPTESLSGVDIEQRLGTTLPLDATFRDSQGRTIKLSDCFGRGRPVLLTFNYFRCPSLCSEQLNALVTALQPLSWAVGETFDVITISFDPRDNARWAAAKKAAYIASYGRPAAASGWSFLTADEDAILAVTRAAGFKYRWIADRQEYAHPAFLAVCTAEGRLARYLSPIKTDTAAVTYPTGTLRLALVESADGQISSATDQLILLCLLRYDASSGKYTLAVIRLVQLGGGLTLALLLGWLVWASRTYRRPALPAEARHPDPAP